MSESSPNYPNPNVDQSVEILDAVSFRNLASEYGFTESTSDGRVRQLSEMDANHVMNFMSDLNRGLRGDLEPRISETPMKVGDTKLLAAEDRMPALDYALHSIEGAFQRGVSPDRIADTLALTLVMAHPFEDGNGRTSRAVGMLLRSDYDEPDYEEGFAVVTESRDIQKERGGFRVYGYYPELEIGEDGLTLDATKAFIDLVLSSETAPYCGTYGAADLTEKGKDTVRTSAARMLAQTAMVSQNLSTT